MYNSDRKMRYIEFAPKKKVILTQLFNAAEQWEIEKGKDLCLFDTKEVIEFLCTEYSKSKAIQLKYFLSDYNEWCRVKEYCTINYAGRLLPASVLEEYMGAKSNLHYVSPEEYKEMVEKIESSPTLTPFHLGAFVSLYEGISDLEDMALLSIYETNFKNKTIKVQSKGTMKVSYSYLKLLQRLLEIEELPGRKYLVYEFIHGGIFRATRSDCDLHGMARKIKKLLLDVRKEFGNRRLKEEGIYDSGIINYVNARAKEKGLDLKSDILNATNSEKYSEILEEKCLNMTFEKFAREYYGYAKYL